MCDSLAAPAVAFSTIGAQRLDQHVRDKGER
jgi:hypothetical protein